MRCAALLTGGCSRRSSGGRAYSSSCTRSRVAWPALAPRRPVGDVVVLVLIEGRLERGPQRPQPRLAAQLGPGAAGEAAALDAAAAARVLVLLAAADQRPHPAIGGGDAAPGTARAGRG